MIRSRLSYFPFVFVLAQKWLISINLKAIGCRVLLKEQELKRKKTYPTLNLSLSFSHYSYLYGITELCKDTWYLRSGCRLWPYQVSHRTKTLSYFFWTVRSQISSIWVPLVLQTYWFKPYLLSLCNFPQSQTITFPCTPPLPPYRRQPNMAPWILQTLLCLPS